jgi:hypothetical protein
MDVQETQSLSAYPQQQISYRNKSLACALFLGLGTTFYYARYRQLNVVGKLLTAGTVVATGIALKNLRTATLKQDSSSTEKKLLLLHHRLLLNTPLAPITDALIEEVVAFGDQVKTLELQYDGSENPIQIMTDKQLKKLLHGLPKLEALILGGIEIRGENFTDLHPHSSLELIWLTDGKITTHQLKELINRSLELYSVDLFRMELVGETFEGLNAPTLFKLSVASEKISATQVGQLVSNMPSLTFFSWNTGNSDAEVGAADLEPLKTLHKLKRSELVIKGLSAGALKEVLPAFTALEELTLLEVPITDEDLDGLDQLLLLTTLQLNISKLSWDAYEKIGTLPLLSRLVLKGKIAEEMMMEKIVEGCDKLTYLQLGDVKLSKDMKRRLREREISVESANPNLQSLKYNVRERKKD